MGCDDYQLASEIDSELVLFNPQTGEILTETAQVTNIALTLPDDLSYPAWTEYGNGLDRMSKAVMWWIGDWWAFGKRHYGDRIKAALGADWNFQTCANAGWVAKSIETSRRLEVLPWSYHQEVASLEPFEQDDFLRRWAEYVATEGHPPSFSAIRAEVSRFKQDRGYSGPTKPEPLADQYCTFIADPPWRYDNTAADNAAANHYETMSIEELCALDIVPTHAADQAHLYLWTTSSHLPEAFQVMAAWGFDYKTYLVWIKQTAPTETDAAKPQMGLGNYFRVSTELVLFGVRGGMRTFDRALLNWFTAPRTAHSAKPSDFRDLVAKASPGPYLELFSRCYGNEHCTCSKCLHGWTVWGNQA